MGRYYDTDGGRQGKFMFGVQPSDDPGYMGMHEQEPTTVEYYADEDDVEKITKKLDEQYDIIGIPKNERLYYCKDWQEMDKYEREVLHDKIFITVYAKDETAIKAHGGETRWASGKGNDYVDFEIKGMPIVLARIRLGLDILSDIKDNGFCALNAEL